MFTQPSVNQIASAYQGNPAPLARKVDQDKKQNGGIPKDLRQLMALNDIAQGKEAIGIDQALKIPTNIPTVAQNTQQLAQQALQARMLQMAREQQKLQQKPPILPDGTPQPKDQPQGIDVLSANVGDGYAEGGIIGFSGTGSSQFVKDISELPQAFDDMKQRAREEDAIKAEQDRRMEKYKQDKLAAQQKTSLFNYLFGTPEREKEGQAKLTELSNAPVSTAVEKPAPVAATPLVDIRRQLNQADAASRAAPGTPPPPKEKPAAQTQTQTRVNADSAPMPGGLKDLAGIPSMGVGRSYERDRLKEDPAKAMADIKALYDKEVGNRDLSIYDKMAEELKARKERLNAPKSGYDATMELLEQIAQGGGRTWMEAGSRGVSGQRALQKARLAEQDTLMEKILDLGAKKAEAQFAEKKGMFDLTQAEKNRIIKDKQAIAQSLGLSEDKERELIQQALENELNRKNQIRAASIGAQDRDNLMSRAKALMAADPTKKMTLEQAMQRAAEIGAAGQMESAEVRRLNAFNAAKKEIDAKPRYIGMLLDKQNKPEYAKLRQEYLAEINAAKAMAGVSDQGINALPGATSSGTVPPPPGFKRD